MRHGIVCTDRVDGLFGPNPMEAVQEIHMDYGPVKLSLGSPALAWAYCTYPDVRVDAVVEILLVANAASKFFVSRDWQWYAALRKAARAAEHLSSTNPEFKRDNVSPLDLESCAQYLILSKQNAGHAVIITENADILLIVEVLDRREAAEGETFRLARAA